MDGGSNFNTAGFADTGQWRLIVTVSRYGISAVLKNLLDQDICPVALFSRDWEGNDDNLQHLVEDAVYDYPRILDDFATQILVYTHKSLWIPEDLTDDEEYDEKFFSSVFETDEEDIFADFGDEEVCLYTLAPGLKSFFQRTLPGCKITSHLTVLKKVFKEMESEGDSTHGATIYLNCRERDADIFAFKCGAFQSGSTHVWKSPNDIAYRALLIAKVYDLDPNMTRIMLLSRASARESVHAVLKRYFHSVVVRELPDFSEKHGIPLAAALAAGDKIINCR